MEKLQAKGEGHSSEGSEHFPCSLLRYSCVYCEYCLISQQRRRRRSETTYQLNHKTEWQDEEHVHLLQTSGSRHMVTVSCCRLVKC